MIALSLEGKLTHYIKYLFHIPGKIPNLQKYKIQNLNVNGGQTLGGKSKIFFYQQAYNHELNHNKIATPCFYLSQRCLAGRAF